MQALQNKWSYAIYRSLPLEGLLFDELSECLSAHLLWVAVYHPSHLLTLHLQPATPV